jgi:hypothetical protein
VLSSPNPLVFIKPLYTTPNTNLSTLNPHTKLVKMRTVIAFGAFALAAQAWEYPYCESEGYRNLIDERFADKAEEWCPVFLAGTTTAASAVPTEFSNCDGNIPAISSACSCITYVPSTSTSSTSTKSSSSSTSSSYSKPTSSASYSHSKSSTSSASMTKPTKPPKYTTSTIYTTTVYTVTSCAPDVPNCPGKPHVTTKTIAVSTTICPVEETETEKPTKSYPPKTTIGTTYIPPKPTNTFVPAGAAQIGGGLAAVAAGVMAAVLL